MEKFGILNLLKALETLTPPPAQSEKNAEQPEPAPPPPPAEKQKAEAPAHNMMADVLSRHEQIANRVKNNRR